MVLMLPYLHDIHSHSLRGHTLYIVYQPMNNLCTDEAVEWQALLLWEQLYACPVPAQSTGTAMTVNTYTVVFTEKYRCVCKNHITMTLTWDV